MQKSKDFANMTLEELTPIVSMRPGKEYTREELRAARAAFMAALEGTSPAPSVASEAAPDETPTETPASVQAAQPAEETSDEAEEMTPEEPEAISADPIEESLAEPAPSPVCLEATVSSVPKPNAFPAGIRELSPMLQTETARFAGMPSAVDASDAEPNASNAEQELQNEEFILKAESRLARFLYILYAYLLVPLLAAESLIFLVASVATAMAVPHIPYVILHIFCAALYTMIVSVAWHQFLHRTQFGLLLNRALIAVCIFRGIHMLLSGGSLFSGIILVALSALFLVFFVGYDNTFVIQSPKRRHVR